MEPRDRPVISITRRQFEAIADRLRESELSSAESQVELVFEQLAELGLQMIQLVDSPRL